MVAIATKFGTKWS